MKNLLSHWNLDVVADESESTSRIDLYKRIAPNVKDKSKLLKSILREKIGRIVDDLEVEQLEEYLDDETSIALQPDFSLNDELVRFDCQRLNLNYRFEELYRNSGRTFSDWVQCHIATAKSQLERLSSEYLIRRLIRDYLLDVGINLPGIVPYKGNIIDWQDNPTVVEWISTMNRKIVLTVGQKVIFNCRSTDLYLLDATTESVVGSSLGRSSIDMTFDEAGVFMIGSGCGLRLMVYVVEVSCICVSLPILPCCTKYKGEFIEDLKMWVDNDRTLKRVELEILPDNLDLKTRTKLLDSVTLSNIQSTDNLSESLSGSKYNTIRSNILVSLASQVEDSISEDELALSSFRAWYQVLQDDSYGVLVNSFESSKFSSVKFQQQISLMLKDPSKRKKMKSLLKSRFSTL